MVDTIRERRQIEWSGTSSQAVVSAGVLVMGIIGAVALAGGALVWNGTSLEALWIGFGLALAWISLRRFAAPKLRPQPAFRVDTVSATERDGSIVYRDARRHRRFVPARRSTTLHLLDGRQVSARVVELSIAAVAVEARLGSDDLSAVTQVGSRAVALVRQTRTGAVFGFDTILDPRTLNASFTL